VDLVCVGKKKTSSERRGRELYILHHTHAVPFRQSTAVHPPSSVLKRAGPHAHEPCRCGCDCDCSLVVIPDLAASSSDSEDDVQPPASDGVPLPSPVFCRTDTWETDWTGKNSRHPSLCKQSPVYSGSSRRVSPPLHSHPRSQRPRLPSATRLTPVSGNGATRLHFLSWPPLSLPLLSHSSTLSPTLAMPRGVDDQPHPRTRGETWLAPKARRSCIVRALTIVTSPMPRVVAASPVHAEQHRLSLGTPDFPQSRRESGASWTHSTEPLPEGYPGSPTLPQGSHTPQAWVDGNEFDTGLSSFLTDSRLSDSTYQAAHHSSYVSVGDAAAGPSAAPFGSSKRHSLPVAFPPQAWASSAGTARTPAPPLHSLGLFAPLSHDSGMGCAVLIHATHALCDRSPAKAFDGKGETGRPGPSPRVRPDGRQPSQAV
jgi:hypothetical protein